MTDSANNVDARMVQVQLAEAHAELRRLRGSGGGDIPPDMERRVSRLEDKTDKLVDGLGEVRVQLATLSEKVAHLPSKAYIDTRLAALLALISAVIVFADKIKSLVGLAH